MAAGVRRFRVGIRGRLLAFLGIAVVFIVGMEIVAQRASARVFAEYESRLGHYHAVHRMRLAFSEFGEDADRFIRDPNAMPIEQLYERISGLRAQYQNILPLEEQSIEAGFEVRAIGYGFDAYFPLVAKSFSLRISGRTDYYADFSKAQRIGGFIDSYFSRLLSVLLKDGEASFRLESERSKRLSDIILFGTIAAGILLLAYVFLVASSITKPIRRLAKASERLAAGNLDVEPIHVRTKDEVGTLAASFQTMSENIRSYIHSLEEKTELERKLREDETRLLGMGKALREAQFMNLQEQMRPHFLFNALNSIARNALLEKAPVTERLTLSLAKILRTTMKAGEPYITLGEEMDIVREYLGFQKARFSDRLDWNIKFDSSLKDAKVPRFLLQPLVENAVRHGVEPKVGPASIMVSARQRGDRMEFHVLDTGVGIEGGALRSLRAMIEAAVAAPEGSAGPSAGIAKAPRIPPDRLVDGSGIGMANVATRLSLMYGPAFGMRIYSNPGKGTIVKLAIPARRTARWLESL